MKDTINQKIEENAVESSSTEASIHIKKEMTDALLHEAIEQYQAAERLKGRKVNKPVAAVELIRIALTSLGYSVYGG